MFGKAFGMTALAALSLAFLSPAARGGDDPEPACDDADVEKLDTTIQCNGGQWILSGEYDVEIEDPSGTQYDLVLTLRNCNRIPAHNCGGLTTFTVPLDTPSPLDADDNDEIEFEGTFCHALEGDMSIYCDRLRVSAEVVERCDRVVLDVEEDKVRALDKGTCSEPQVALVSACDPCGEALVSRTSLCDPCGDARVTTVSYEDSGYRRVYVDDDDDDDGEVEIEVDDDEVEIERDD